MDSRREWVRVRNSLVRDIVTLGFSEEPGDALAKQLGSPKRCNGFQSIFIM